MPDDGLVARAVEVVAISEVEAQCARPTELDVVYTERELAYARSKSDPARRLAARLAAKRAAQVVLGGDVPLREIEVEPAVFAPPRLRLSDRAKAELARRGGGRILVSLTHGATHAAAVVLILADGDAP